MKFHDENERLLKTKVESSLRRNPSWASLTKFFDRGWGGAQKMTRHLFDGESERLLNTKVESSLRRLDGILVQVVRQIVK